MKIAILGLLAVVTMGVAACGGSSHPPAISHPAAVHTTTTPATTTAKASEAALASALAASIMTVTPSLVSGPVMEAYIQFEHGFSAGYAAIGSPDQPETVSAISGGYELCEGSSCEDFTGFTANAQGQITGASVNGQPIAGRIASGTDSSANGLEVSDVYAYRLTEPSNTVVVTFRIQDTSYTPVNNDPAVLASFITPDGQVSENDVESGLPSALSPGASVYGFATFGTSDATGTFQLIANGSGSVLGSSTITLAGS